ncbi:uncharacterized protein LOC141774785 [Sebastes fasciatus]|uniref:uncharacterized protein LOC141774785 n=1 Tax=Sebastes fasciatus TaxID=394691 RepID=UPI003D9F1C30
MEYANANKRPASTTTQTPTQTPRKHKKNRVVSTESLLAKQERDRPWAKTRINICGSFDSWRELRLVLGLKTDPELAKLLLDSFKKTTTAVASQGPVTSTPGKQPGLWSNPASTIGEESERDDFLMAGVGPLAEDQALEALEESIKSMDLLGDYVLVDEEQANSHLNTVIELEDQVASDRSDVDSAPPIFVRAGGALQMAIDRLPIVGLEESVLDIHDREDAENMNQNKLMTQSNSWPVTCTPSLALSGSVVKRTSLTSLHASPMKAA